MKLPNFKKIVNALLSAVELSTHKLSDGSTVQTDGEVIEVGAVVYLLDEAGDPAVLADGKYELKSKFSFVITEGIVSEVDASAEVKPVEETAPKEQALCECEKKEGEDIKINAAEGDASASGSTEVVAAAEETIPAVVNVDVNQLIQAAVAPLYDEIYKLTNLVEALTNLGKDTQTALSKVADKVVVLSKEPASPSIQESLNPLNRNTPKDVTDSRAFKMFSAKSK